MGYRLWLPDSMPTKHADQKREPLTPVTSEQRIASLLVDGIKDYAVFMLDPHGRVASWNTGAERIKGYKASEIIGAHFSCFYPAADARAGVCDRILAQALEQGRIETEGWRVRKDGSQFWGNVVITALRDEKQTLLGFAKVTRDLTERRRAEATERELAREQAARAASEKMEAQLKESEERYRDLSARLEVILDGVADGITVQDSTGRVVFANFAAARLCGFDSPDEFLSTPVERVMHRFEVFNEAGKPFLPQDFPGRRALDGLEPGSALIRTRDRATGREWWSLIRASAVMRDGKPHLAVNIWHEVTLERKRAQALEFLAQASASLATSLEVDDTLRALARTIVPAFADWCTVDLVEGRKLRTVAVAHVDPNRVEGARQLMAAYPPDPDNPHGMWNVLRTGRSELHAHISEALLRSGTRSSEHFEAIQKVDMRSIMIVPIRMRHNIVGTMAFVWAESGYRYDEHDLALAEELGRRAGAALENANLYAAEKQARAHLALLARAGELFALSASHEEILRHVVSVTLPDLGDFGFFDVVEGNEVRRIPAAFEDEETQALLAQTSWAKWERKDKNLCGLSSGKAGIESHIDEAWLRDSELAPEQAELFRRLRLGSLITVPLLAHERLMGALTLCFGKSGRHHTHEQLELAEELARRATIALEQARMYTAAQEAAKRAEDANRLKDEFLATVSHELRTPLNAMLGWTTLLRQRSLEPSVARALDVIYRNCRAQVQIVDDILDVSRIINGKFHLDLKPIDLLTLATEALEVARPSAIAKEIHLELRTDAQVCLLVGDPDRLQQVIWNLVSNAVKFTEKGGRVELQIGREGASVTLSVQDTGRGIDSDFLPFVFERFKQADSSTTRRFGGLGLGLAVVRHIVELHGGQVFANSPGPGLGATFKIVIPIRAVQPKVPALVAPTNAASDEQAVDVTIRGLRVLVVDDDPDARELLEEVLSGQGVFVETADSAHAGFDALQRFRPDVLVSDIGMPGEDGYSFMQRIRRLEPDHGGSTPAIALTAYTRPEDRTQALAAGYTTHIGKPVNHEDLRAAIANLGRLSRKSA
jgi:PAS domain S-box-containing protein